jgi:hypothetical protein
MSTRPANAVRQIRHNASDVLRVEVDATGISGQRLSDLL